MTDSKKTVKVGQGFSKFMAKNASAFQEAKMAENSMQTCAMPIGWKGQCVCVSGIADQGKDRKDDKGNMVPGNPYMRLEFAVVGDPEYAGKKFSIGDSFYDSKGATAMDRYTWFLNRLENLGLPKDIRQNHESPNELLDFFVNSDTVFDVEVGKASYVRSGSDGKEMIVRQPDVSDRSTSMAPPEPKEHTNPNGSSPVKADGYSVGQTIKFVDNDWEVVEVLDGTSELKIKSPRNGNIRTIKFSDVEG